jgi:lipopolysaccharide biosynthesis glycosyltransferase
MENKINAVTIASDAQFHLARVSVHSFIETNKWFNGKITLVVHPNFPLSSLNLSKLKAIYQNIEIVLFSQAVAISPRLKITPAHVQDQLRCFIFSFAPSKLLFFSNTCLFMKDVTPILQPNKIMVAGNYSIFYVDSPNTAYTDSLNKTSTDSYLNCLKNSLLQTNTVEYTDTLGVLASTVPDPKYMQLARTLANASFIDYDTVAYSDPKYGKINQVWLYQNHLLNHKLSKPLTFNSAVHRKSQPLNFNPVVHKKSQPSPKKIQSAPTLTQPDLIKESNLYFNCSSTLSDKKLALCTICNNKFTVGAKVLIYSFILHNPWYTQDIIIFHSRTISPLSSENMEDLKTVYSNIKFIEVDESEYSRLITRLRQLRVNSRFIPSIFTFEPFDLIKQYDKILYLDSDMLVRGDLSELFVLPENIVVTPDAATYNVSRKYFTFNGGFLLIDSKSENYKKILISTGEKSSDLRLADQSLLNHVLNKSVKMISSKYNCLKRCFPDSKFSHFDDSIKIVHYVGAKPWNDTKSGHEKNYSKIENLWADVYLQMKNSTN